MRILVACESSGRVRDALIARGHDAVSCDLKPSEAPGPHYQGDVREILRDGWDAMIAHPDCTFLSVSGLHWNKRNPERAKKTEAGMAFVMALVDAPIDLKVIENPVSCISSRWRKPDQIVQPYDFGADASKATCFWYEGWSPRLVPPPGYGRVPGRIVRAKNGKLVERWSNQTDEGQNRLGPSETRAEDRSRTYEGIALALARLFPNEALV